MVAGREDIDRCSLFAHLQIRLPYFLLLNHGSAATLKQDNLIFRQPQSSNYGALIRVRGSLAASEWDQLQRVEMVTDYGSYSLHYPT